MGKFTMAAMMIASSAVGTMAAQGTYHYMREKKNYGRAYLGVIRSTFVISPTGRIEHVFSNVKATGHVAKLIRDLALA